MAILLEQYTERNTPRDCYACVIQVVEYSGKGTVPILLVVFYSWILRYIMSCEDLTILVMNQIFISPSYHLSFLVTLACAGVILCDSSSNPMLGFL